jgi:hypothetical protein
MQQCETLLTPTQKQLLAQRRAAARETRTPGEPTTTEPSTATAPTAPNGNTPTAPANPPSGG